MTYEEPQEVEFNPLWTVTVPINDLTSSAFNWAVAAATGEPISVHIGSHYEWHTVTADKRIDSYWGDEMGWYPDTNRDLLHEFITKYLISTVPLNREGTLWRTSFLEKPELVAEDSNLIKAVSKLLILGHFGEMVPVPFQLQCMELALKELQEKEAEDAIIERQFDIEDDLFLIEEQLRNQ